MKNPSMKWPNGQMARWPKFLLVCALLVNGRAAPAYAQAAPAPPQRFTVESDGHPLTVWARIPASPRGAVLLLHGRTWSARPAFDLQVAGLHRSVLDSLQAQGFAAYALDARGYGATPRDETGWLTPNRAAADVSAVLSWIAGRHQTLRRPALVGWSLGGSIAHLTAATTPSLMSAVAFFGYAPNPDTVPEGADTPAKPVKFKNSRTIAGEDFVSPKVTPKAVVRAFVDTAIKTDPILVDWRNLEEFTYDSSQLMMPTLVTYGDRDPSIDPTAAKYFFSAIDTANKQLVVIPGGDHCAHLEDTHDLWISTVVQFLERFAR
jgi:alpha-beta hydrolase superfamily lysophospholipase